VRNDEEAERSLDIVAREAKRLSHLVENVLVDSRSVRGVLRASPVRMDVSRRVADLADELAPLAEAGGAHVRCRIASGIVAELDPELLHQAVGNLLDNAVKFGPRGQTVTVGAERAGKDVRIWVEDQGPGIPAAHRDRVGERFYRLARDRDGAVAGTGIGLSVVRDVARLHGGRLEVEDGDGSGARVVLRIPAGEESE
jgi:signal transduction histidine kinase